MVSPWSTCTDSSSLVLERGGPARPSPGRCPRWRSPTRAPGRAARSAAPRSAGHLDRRQQQLQRRGVDRGDAAVPAFGEVERIAQPDQHRGPPQSADPERLCSGRLSLGKEPLGKRRSSLVELVETSATEQPAQQSRRLRCGAGMAAAPPAAGTPRLTLSTCWPQPAQVVLPHCLQVTA